MNRAADEPTNPDPGTKRPTPEQKAVIRHRTGHARLLAGPGTGKTDTFAWRAKDLIEADGIEPEKIMMLSYSRLSAHELGLRLRRYRATNNPIPKTLHSYALEQLRRNKVSSVCGERVVDLWEMTNFFRDDLASRIGTTGPKAQELLNAMQADWRMLKDEDKALPEERAALEDALRALRHVYDFALLDELVYRLKRWAEKQPSFKPSVSFVMVDEFQDLNKCDQALIRLIQERSGAQLMVAGDDDQSIHKWRQANPDGLRSFPADYKAVSFELTECWRCGQNIIDHSFAVIEPVSDRDRSRKKLTSKQVNKGDVLIVAAKSAQESPKAVGALVHHLVRTDKVCTTGDILVLVPRRGLAPRYVEALTSAGMRAANLVQPGAVLDTPSARRLIYALLFSLAPDDSVSLRGLVKLAGGIGPMRVRPIIDEAITKGTTFVEATRRSSDGKVKTLLETIAGFPPIKHETTAKDAITAMAAYLGTSDADRDGLLDLTQAITGDLKLEIDQTLLAVREFRLSEQSGGEENPDGPVRVMSFRQAKGLSAQVVIVTDLDDEIVPGGDDKEHVEEQRRLLYVSMTRAISRLYLLYCGTRSRDPSAFAGTGASRRPWEQRTISRFLDELEIPVKKIGDIVKDFR